MSESIRRLLEHKDFPRLASVLRTTKAAVEGGERLDLNAVYLGDPRAVVADLDALLALNVSDSELREWIVWNTKSVDGTLEEGFLPMDSLESVRRHCEVLIAAANRA